MSVSAPHTEETLTALLHQWLGISLSGALVWSAGTPLPNSYSDMVVDILVLYGVDTMAEATELGRLRGLARLVLWRTAASALAGKYDISTDGQALKLSQMYDHAKEQAAAAYATALTEGWVASTAGTITRSLISYRGPDIYGPLGRTGNEW